MTDRNILIVGAGKIGRSFIGQIFGRNGYRVVFVDTDELLVNQLNRAKRYSVISRGPDLEEQVIIENVSALSFYNSSGVVKALGNAGIVALSAGKASLGAIAPLIAEGLQLREEMYPGRVLDIILAENMRSAGHFFRELLKEHLPPEFPLEERVGFVETSIGKMAPILTAEELKEDPLRVVSEPYNTLILGKNGFKGVIPDLPELALKDHIEAWVDRKSFIHNLGHAVAAYHGYLKYPGTVYINDLLEHKEVLSFTRSTMEESAQVLLATYPNEFTAEDLSAHIDDLLARFRNPKLGDTIFRVGCDLRRKLGPDDRFMAIIRQAVKTNRSFGLILEAMAMGFRFKATGENGQMFPGDVEFHRLSSDNLDQVLEQICGLNANEDADLIAQLKKRIYNHTTE